MAKVVVQVAALLAVLVTLGYARQPHVHPLSQFKPPIGVRQRREGDFGAVLTATPSVLYGNGGMVNVTWSNYLYPKSTDWIGLFCPASISAYDVAPIKFRWLPVSANLSATSGSIQCYVMNLRADCKFVLFSGGAQFPLIEAVSNTVTMVHFNYPSSLRLAFPTPDGTSPTLRVSWTTLNVTQPAIRFGTQPGQYTATVAAETYTYAASDLCTAPANTRGWYPPGSLHTAVVTALTPNTKYYYTVGDLSQPTDPSVWSPESSFVAPGPRDDVVILAFGDMGNAPTDGTQQHSWDYDNHGELNSLNTTLQLAQELNGPILPSAVVHFGDISYAVGYESEWDQFHEQIRPIASVVPWMVGIGNHEMDVPTSFIPGTDSGGECGVTYSQRFIMPPPADTRTPKSPWYQFTVGPVHVIMMSSEHDFAPSSPQYTFLQQALLGVDRKKTPWLVFCGHRPMYVDSTWSDTPYSDQGFASNLRNNLENLLVSAQVDLAMWGHHHSYQRTCNVINEVCDPRGPVHIVVGTAGYELTNNFVTPQPAYIQKAINTYWGFTRIHASTTTLKLEFVTVEDGNVQDTVTLSK